MAPTISASATYAVKSIVSTQGADMADQPSTTEDINATCLGLSSADAALPPTPDDIDRWNCHISLKDFGVGLQAAAKSVFPNESRSRYTRVTVLMLSWEDEDPNLPVSIEISKLLHVFRNIYHFDVEIWKIPDRNSQWALTQRVMDFVCPAPDDKEHLKIVYYAGHGRLTKTRSLAWTSWQNRDKAAPSSLQWSGIQVLLEQAESDVLILLDCCASGTANSGEGNGASELISACAYNATANGVGPYSFTSALVIELCELSKKTSFSVGELYSNIFIRSQTRMPEDGRERHPAPVHLVLTRPNEFPRSIQLSRMRLRVEGRSKGEVERSLSNSTTLPNLVDADQRTQWAARSPNSSPLIETNDALSSIPSKDSNGRTCLDRNSVPRLAFAVRLNESFETGELSIDAFVEWLRTIPTLVEAVKIEAGFESFSSLLIISLPIAFSSYMPRNPAIFSLGPIRSSNKVTRELDENIGSCEISSQLFKAIPRMEDDFEVQTPNVLYDDVGLRTSSSTPTIDIQAAIPPKTHGRRSRPEVEDKSTPSSSLETSRARSYWSTGASLFPGRNYKRLHQYLSRPLTDQIRHEVIRRSEETLPLLPTSPKMNAPSTDSTVPVIYYESHGKESLLLEVPNTGCGRESYSGTIGARVSPGTVLRESPIASVLFLLFGLTVTVGHHLYYSYLSGKRVGGDQEQLWAFRFEATLAFITQATLVCSTGFTFVQYLWRSLKNTSISVKSLDAAFEADHSIVSMLNEELISKVPVVALLALVSFCLPWLSIVHPETLFIVPNLETTWTIGNASSLDINSVNQADHFMYSMNARTGSNDNKIFLGPRTILQRLAAVTAAEGQILPISPPYLNSSYSMHFYGPSIECSTPNSTVESYIDFLRNESMVESAADRTGETANYYYAFVPDLSNLGNTSTPNNGIQQAPHARFRTLANASKRINQLWMVYSRIADESGTRTLSDHYTTCQLFNSSYDINLSFNQGFQIIIPENVTQLNEVDYPDINAQYSNDLMERYAYSAYFWAIADLLTGSMCISSEYTPISSMLVSNYTEIATQIGETSLLGSSDLDIFFDGNLYLNNLTVLSDQKLADIGLARNDTLDVLIPELGFNVTMSLMSSDLLSPRIPTNITFTTAVNKYAYRARNLFVSYFIVLAFTLINVLGAYACWWSEEHSHKKAFLDYPRKHVRSINSGVSWEKTRGRLPLPNKSMVLGEQEENFWAFGFDNGTSPIVRYIS